MIMIINVIIKLIIRILLKKNFCDCFFKAFYYVFLKQNSVN